MDGVEVGTQEHPLETCEEVCVRLGQRAEDRAGRRSLGVMSLHHLASKGPEMTLER